MKKLTFLTLILILLLTACGGNATDGTEPARDTGSNNNTGKTDIELECIAQTWSEHCSHKIFAGTVNYRDEETGEEETIHSLYKTYVKASTKNVMATM